MDPIVQKAFDVANYMTTLSNQKAILKEEFLQNLIHYQNGGTFTVTRELINFVKSLIDLGYEEDIVLVDDNQTPINIDNLKPFLEVLLEVYQSSISEYFTKYSQLKNSRKVEALVK
ncbi:MAG: hypothetical protein EB127_29120 [Alphaproteobacteria bacterium]|nr:hypothetical protein [Alphaproteobacteria bacterium]